MHLGGFDVDLERMCRRGGLHLRVASGVGQLPKWSEDGEREGKKEAASGQR